jgi:hypothetical protein
MPNVGTDDMKSKPTTMIVAGSLHVTGKILRVDAGMHNGKC